MNVQVMISTMHQPLYDFSILDRLNIQTSAVVINQCDRNDKYEFSYKKNHIIWIDTKERGLSKSRNKALDNATGDICIVADDDEILIDGYSEMVEKAFSLHPNYCIIRFKVDGIEQIFKKYPQKEKKISWLSSMKVSSVEIAFNREKIISKSIRFDECIGAGTSFFMGEENSFLWKCLKKHLNIYYIPKSLCQLHIGNSSWFDGYNERYFMSKGAAFTSMSRLFSVPLILQFAFRKKKYYCKDMSVNKSIQCMIAGHKAYIKEREKNN